MPQYCPKCGQLQPDGPKCLNCGAKFEVPVETSQGSWVTRRQLRDYALAIILLAVVIMLFFCGAVALIFWLAG